MLLPRRGLLLGLAGAVTLGRVKLALATLPGQKRFVVIVLRGALDGMSSVVPYGDPHLAALRAPLIPPAPGQPGGMFDLGGFYGLSPYLPNLHAMYQAGQMLPVHAVAGPYRTRSHFEAQDLLEQGLEEETSTITSGWLNRVLAELPPSRGAQLAGISAGIGTPVLMDGPQPIASYAPEGFATPPPALYAQIQALNARDPLLGPALAEAWRANAFDAATFKQDAGSDGDGTSAPGAPEMMDGGSEMAMQRPASLPDTMSDDASRRPGDTPRRGGGFPVIAGRIGELLAADDGPRVAAFQLEGWDTHGNQFKGLQYPLTSLDQGLQGLKTALGPAWNDTAVLIVTEFGRTAAMNGTKGTDHGTATAAYLLGGQIAGGRVRATWPGLGPSQLFQNRDLAPTGDVRSVAKGILAEHLGLDGAALARVFPASGDAAPLQGLVRAT